MLPFGNIFTIIYHKWIFSNCIILWQSFPQTFPFNIQFSELYLYSHTQCQFWQTSSLPVFPIWQKCSVYNPRRVKYLNENSIYVSNSLFSVTIIITAKEITAVACMLSILLPHWSTYFMLEVVGTWGFSKIKVPVNHLSPLYMTGSSKTKRDFQLSIQCHTPEDRTLLSHLCMTFKSCCCCCSQ